MQSEVGEVICRVCPEGKVVKDKVLGHTGRDSQRSPGMKRKRKKQPKMPTGIKARAVEGRRERETLSEVFMLHPFSPTSTVPAVRPAQLRHSVDLGLPN